MKIKITEVSASAEELRQSNTIAEGLANILRGAFQVSTLEEACDEETEVE